MPETTGQRIVREWCTCEFSEPSLAERIDAAIAEAQRDTVRLDWIFGHISQKRHGSVAIEQRDGECCVWGYQWETGIRAAIDAARAKVEGERHAVIDKTAKKD